MNRPRSDKGKSLGLDFLRSLIGHQGQECVPWPYGCDLRGYGTVGQDGKVRRASRVMCTMAHGEPPTPKHHAAHSCGKGHDACVNPNHLDWKTASENQYDRRKHGTHGGGGGRRGKLTPAQWQEIREAKGKVTQAALAAHYGVSDATIRGIQSGRWGTGAGTRWITHRGQTLLISDWAKEIGVRLGTLRARLKRLPEAEALDAAPGRWPQKSLF